MDFELSKEQQDIIQAAREFALGEFPDRALEFDREETFDYAIWKKACDLGFVGMNISEEYGGAGLGILEVCLVMEEFWAVDAGIGGAILTTSFSADLIDMFGTEAQKKKYLTPLPAGKEITAGAITEPDAGSDVSMVSTTAVKERMNTSSTAPKCSLVMEMWPAMSLYSVKRTRNIRTNTKDTVGLWWNRTERDSRPISFAENSVSAPMTRPS